MELILWRHAEAEDGTPDLARALTAKGHRQAEAMGGWLATRLDARVRILVSPATRAQQTARYLGRKFETVPEIAPGADPQSLLEAAAWPEAGGVILMVGHQPALGAVASLSLCGEAREFSLKKGAVVWIEHRARDGVGRGRLRAALDPGLL